MENAIKLNFKKPIYTLTIASLVLAAINFVYRLIELIDYFEYIAYYDLDFTDYLLEILSSLIWYIWVVPIILFAIYTFKSYHKGKARAIMPITFGLIIFPIFIFILSCYLSLYIPIIDSVITYIELEFSWFNSNYSLIQIISFISLVAGFVVLLTPAKNEIKKIFLIIAMAFSIASILLALYILIDWIGNGFTVNIPLLSMYFSKLSLYVGMLLFFIKNNLSNKSSASKIINIHALPPERALRYLNRQLQDGTITMEEYTIQRAQIISRL